MYSEYSVWLHNAYGRLLAVLSDFISLSYTRVVNDIGVLQLVLRRDFDISLIKLDGRIAVYRRGSYNAGQYLDTGTIWFIRKWSKELGANGDEVITVTAFSAVELLNRRIIAYAAGAAQAAGSNNADNLMKNIVKQNLGSTATDSNRDISSYLSVEANASIGPTVKMAYSRKNVLATLQKIAQSTITQGSPIYFDIVAPTGGSTLEFRTYKNVRGTDHSISGSGGGLIVLSPERGNLANVRKEYDYTEEVTFVYAAGQGLEDERQVKTASSVRRIALSPFNRREKLADSRQVSASSSSLLLARAQAALREGRPVRLFSGEFVDTPGTQYGVNWRWGDKIAATYDGETFDCVVDAIKVEIHGGKETITPTLRVVEDD